MTNVAYNSIKITGDVSIEPASTLNHSRSVLILLVGPTGSGKSSFIEALAGPKSSLGISKDQLEGFTQELSVFNVINVHYDSYPIALVDCPGFADRKLSENEIILKIRKWMGNHNLFYFDRIWYFTPVTDTRLPGSKRNVISMFRELCGNGHDNIAVVTTMWDTICNDGMHNRAESNFLQLKADVWKESRSVTQFFNTQESSLAILDDTLHTGQIVGLKSSVTSKFMYDNLLERIAMAQQEVKFANDELSHPGVAEQNKEAREIALAQREEARERLKRFSRQLVDYGPPPLGCKPVVVPWSLLTAKQKRERAKALVKKVVFGHTAATAVAG